MVNKGNILGKFHSVAEKARPQEGVTFGEVSQPELVSLLFSFKLSPSGRRSLVLLAEKGTQNQRSLAHALDISPQAMSETIKKLLDHGCITKENGKQKNENFISLTPLGEDLAQLLVEMIQNHAEDFFQSFSEEDLLLFEKLLEQLLGTLEK
ncbi:MAG: MarR family winged helix-turn-helix transcriptional regulator [Eubacteriales bacterium]